MALLNVSLLGPFETVTIDKEPVKFQTNKVQALFIILAAEPASSHQRADLMELLWPGLP